MGRSEPVSSPDKGGELGCDGDPCKIQPRIHMRTRNKDYSAMERTYSRSQCGGPRAAVPAIALPGPGDPRLAHGGPRISLLPQDLRRISAVPFSSLFYYLKQLPINSMHENKSENKFF